MSQNPDLANANLQVDDDIENLHKMGYGQELLRRMSGFSNYAISLSIICILAGCITSFQFGLCSVGGAAIGIGWIVSGLISFCFALTMGQVASAYPTAGGLYHWASILGGRGWGWATAWFNLLGLITVLSAINVGTYLFAISSLGPFLGIHDPPLIVKIVAVTLITLTQAVFNHRGIKVTTKLTDFSGWWILIVSFALTAALLIFAKSHDFSRLWTFTNFSGLPAADAAKNIAPVWPATSNLVWLFFLGLLLPAYTITGFDASAHTSEETVGAARNVPKAIVQAVLVSGISGWIMLCAVVLAAPDLRQAAMQGGDAFAWIMNQALPAPLPLIFFIGIVLAQYLCGLATLTSASRMIFAFARDGGLPASDKFKKVSPEHRTPANAIWLVAILSVLFAISAYSTITAVCTILLYISYMVPTALGFVAYGRSWTQMGPWSIGGLYRPLAAICVLGCALFILIGIQPPNELALPVLLGIGLLMLICWFAYIRKVFVGPPVGKAVEQRQAAIAESERKVGQTGDLTPSL